MKHAPRPEDRAAFHKADLLRRLMRAIQEAPLSSVYLLRVLAENDAVADKVMENLEKWTGVPKGWWLTTRRTGRELVFQWRCVSDAPAAPPTPRTSPDGAGRG